MNKNKAPEWAQWLRACVISEEVTGSKPAGGRVAHMTCCGKARRVGDPTGTSRPLLSHKLLVYLACRLLDIPLGGCCSHGKKKNILKDYTLY